MDKITQFMGIYNEDDHMECRIAAYDFANMCGFNDIDRVRITTAVSEIVRNVLNYAKYGEMCLMWNGSMLTITVSDEGPGIENVELAMQDGYSTKGGLGIGLSGSKRLMGGIEIHTVLGSGTTVIMRLAARSTVPPPKGESLREPE